MNGLLHDLRQAFRVLRKDPWFGVVSGGTLALGIGATTAIFSVVYGVLLRPLPYERPDRLVRVWEQAPDGHRMDFADPNFEDLRDQSLTLAGAAEYTSGPAPVTGGSQPSRTVVALVSRDFLKLMRVKPVRGRGFTAADHRFGAAPVALVSQGYWQRAFGGRGDLASVRLVVDQQPISVVGVLPAGFALPGQADIWVPREMLERVPSRSAHNWAVLARLGDGVTLAGARAELATIGARLQREHGTEVDCVSLAAAPLQEALTGGVARPLVVLLAAVGLLLLIACADVANLLLARAASREPELALRAALGAPRGRLVRQLVIEVAVLAAVAGALGVLLARWGVDALLALAPADMPRLSEVAIDAPVLLFSVGLAGLLALGLGGFAAWRATGADPQRALAERTRSATGSQRVARMSRALVAGQLAVALTLLVGASLLGRSLVRVLDVDPGFRTDRIATLDLALPDVTTPGEKAARAQFLEELFARLSRLPDVEDVGSAGNLPLASPPANGTFASLAPGTPPPTSMAELGHLLRESPATGDADYVTASTGYFRTLGIPLRRGRLFDARDRQDAPHVAVVSESLARATWPGRDPLGQVVEFGNMDGDLRPLTVVGVVGDIRSRTLERAPRPTIYVDLLQRPQQARNLTVVMRTGSRPAQWMPAARGILQDLDPSVAPSFGTFTRVVTASVQTRRLDLTLIAAFALIALLLAAAGLYGAMAYSVAQRRVELGVRMALGAEPGRMLRLVLGQGLRVCLLGTAVGTLAALLLTRGLTSLLFGVDPVDPLTFVGVALGLTLVALLAAWIPARQAMQADPAVILRQG